MSHGHFLRALREYGVKGTFEKLYKMRTIKVRRRFQWRATAALQSHCP